MTGRLMLPPIDENGNPICGRECDDGTPCQTQVEFRHVACEEHRGQVPIVGNTL